MPRVEEMLVSWQCWVSERTSFIRFFDSGDLAAAFPEYPQAHGLEPGMRVCVLYNVDDGLPMKLRGRLVDAIADAAKHGFVVLKAEYA